MKFYFDEHIPRKVAERVRQSGHTVIMAVDVGMIAKDDDKDHLIYATKNACIVFTHDRAFAGRNQSNLNHAGLICWTGKDNDFGGMIAALITFAEVHTHDDAQGQIFWVR